MKGLLLIPIAAILIACGSEGFGRSMTESQLEGFFRGRTVNGKPVVAVKKRTLGGAAYLLTVHVYPNNLSVCEELIKPYNENPSMSVLPGEYFCEELR